MSNIWVLGRNGMLGRACFEVFNEGGLQSIGITRSDFDNVNNQSRSNIATSGKITKQELLILLKKFGTPSYIVNAIGVVKPRIKDDVESIANAYHINAIFPHVLDSFAESIGAIVLQIGTDCIFSGNRGNYSELDISDATDHYGTSKFLGELQTENTKILRSSIIGIEQKNKYSLVSWVDKQEKGHTVNGYSNHFWNGITTRSFAHIVKGIIRHEFDLKEKQHIVPSNLLNKYDLVRSIAKALGRDDLKIVEANAIEPINRTLITLNPEINAKLWKIGGFQEIPTVEFLVDKYLM